MLLQALKARGHHRDGGASGSGSPGGGDGVIGTDTPSALSTLEYELLALAEPPTVLCLLLPLALALALLIGRGPDKDLCAVGRAKV